MDDAEQLIQARIQIARLEEQVKASDKAVIVARAHWLSAVSAVISVLALLIAMFKK